MNNNKIISKLKSTAIYTFQKEVYMVHSLIQRLITSSYLVNFFKKILKIQKTF